MEFNNQRREFLKKSLKYSSAGAGALILPFLSGLSCSPRLTTDIETGFKESNICTNQEPFNLKRIRLLNEPYFAVTLTTKEDLKEPSFGLIPEKESRVRITNVGKYGVGVIADAPNGIYLPYALDVKKTGRSKEYRLKYPEDKRLSPVKLDTSKQLPKLRNQRTRGKISIEDLTEKDFLFSDEVLERIASESSNETQLFNSEKYLINKMGDYNKMSAKLCRRRGQDILGFYLTQLPVDIIFNRAIPDKTDDIRISGITYVFKKGQQLDDYLINRKSHLTQKDLTKKVIRPSKNNSARIAE